MVVLTTVTIFLTLLLMWAGSNLLSHVVVTVRKKAPVVSSRGYSFKAYGGPTDIANDMARCQEISVDNRVTVSNHVQMPFDIKRFLVKFSTQLEQYEKMMDTLVAEQIEHNRFENWFQFLGLAVWHHESNSHVYVLRISYSKTGDRRKPQFSLMFIDDIGENISLVGEGSSSLLHVDFFWKKDGEESYGPEDPRLVIKGDTLLVVFNMIDQGGNRKMHVLPVFGNRKLLVLLVAGPPSKTEKNWAPFYDPDHPEKLFFVYRWEHLQVVECDLSLGLCDVVTGDHSLTAPISAFRGGTPLIPFSGGWLGFNRAHLIDCGCGFELYRPNFVIIVKDGSGGYCLSHISPYVDFNLPMTLWSGNDDVCESVLFQPNALIPNGIDHLEDDKYRLWYSINDILVESVEISGLTTVGDWKCRKGQLHLYCALGESYQRCADYYFKYSGSIL